MCSNELPLWSWALSVYFLCLYTKISTSSTYALATNPMIEASCLLCVLYGVGFFLAHKVSLGAVGFQFNYFRKERRCSAAAWKCCWNLPDAKERACTKWYWGSTKNYPLFLNFYLISFFISIYISSILLVKGSSEHCFLCAICTWWFYFFSRLLTNLEMAFLLSGKLLLLVALTKLWSKVWPGECRYFWS
jgi:hypothetical protein